MQLFKSLLIIATFCATASAQSFEVASIRINQAESSGVDGRRIRIQASPQTLVMRNVTLMSCLRWAYDVHDYQIIGGPDWRGSERYDIVAKAPAAASEPQLRLMLQALLAERFKLAVRRESQLKPAYILTINKNGHRLRPATREGQRGLRPAERGLAFQNASMADLEQFLSSLPLMDRPVLDRTGLAGRFDFTLALFDSQAGGKPVANKDAVASTAPAVYGDALERIGLRLEERKVATDILIIDHVQKPSGN